MSAKAAQVYTPSRAKKDSTACTHASGFSTSGRCPQCGKTTNSALAMLRRYAWAWAVENGPNPHSSPYKQSEYTDARVRMPAVSHPLRFLAFYTAVKRRTSP